MAAGVLILGTTYTHSHLIPSIRSSPFPSTQSKEVHVITWKKQIYDAAHHLLKMYGMDIVKLSVDMAVRSYLRGREG